MQLRKFFNKKWKVVVAIFLGLAFLGALVGEDEPKKTESANVKTSVEENSTEEPLKEEVKEEPKLDVATMELTSENISAIAKEFLGEDVTSTIEDTEAGKTVDVNYFTDTYWDEESLIKKHSKDSQKLFEELFKNPNIDKVWVWGETTFTDAKGNESRSAFANVALTRANASDINWENFGNLVTQDYKNLYKVVDEYYVHPGILSEIE